MKEIREVFSGGIFDLFEICLKCVWNSFEVSLVQFKWIVSDDGRIIPAGVDVKISFDIMMMNAKYFPNPSHFDPERFASGHLHQEQLAYFPFSVGKRDCIGKKFAILNIKTALCRVLQNFELIAMGDEPIIRNEITAQSINGFQMALTPRKQLQWR